MSATPFIPNHIQATTEDFVGNNGIGRYIILPGSDGRAEEIAKFFNKVEVKKHPRGHHLYKGTINHGRKTIDVATISTGMGCPSMEIILHELHQLGAKRFLRVGTAGSLQPWIKIGDIINVQASVRDENTSVHYAPIEFPAVASLELTSSVLLAAENIEISDVVHTGIVHCKSALYAREFSAGPQSAQNDAYKKLLQENGVLASEMETATLFIQTQYYNQQLQKEGAVPQQHVLAGAILAITTEDQHTYSTTENSELAIAQTIKLSLETIKTLAIQELFN